MNPCMTRPKVKDSTEYWLATPVASCTVKSDPPGTCLMAANFSFAPCPSICIMLMEKYSWPIAVAIMYIGPPMTVGSKVTVVPLKDQVPVGRPIWIWVLPLNVLMNPPESTPPLLAHETQEVL
jgi:hypothetical protein